VSSAGGLDRTNWPYRLLLTLHFFEADSPQAKRHIAFRDYLRAHREVAEAYEIEKRRARELYPDNSHAYSDEKGAWIRNIETKALIWFGGPLRSIASQDTAGPLHD
jgi:GrpB-like predicted nucleotidyltransferase (UPF0157 family)